MSNMITLTTPKGEQVYLNFEQVAYCHKTNNNNTSIRFNYGIGEQNKGAYLVVVEDFDTILGLLG